MNGSFEGLDPRPLWRHFLEIAAIPRCSGKEEGIRQYVLRVAEEAGLPRAVDRAGNVLVRKGAQFCPDGAPCVVLQSHLDMVCEKNLDVDHDFDRDPIRVALEGQWLSARGTTLGADNGIGVAAILAVLEDRSLVHGPLEALFTVDEERGLLGASQIEEGFFSGQILLNFDSEEEGAFVIGCAGGADTVFRLPVRRRRRKGGRGLGFEVKVTGLRGGHSGMDIHLGRGNAIKILVRALAALQEKIPVDVVSIQGGDKRNAIPREALAQLLIRPSDVEKAGRALEEVFREIGSEYGPVETELSWSFAPQKAEFEPLQKKSQDLVLDLLRILPHGVLAMSRAMPDMVETSTNLARVRTDLDRVEIVESTRSARAGALAEVRGSLRALGRVARCELEQPEGYPGWPPEPDSPFLHTMKALYRDLFGKEAQIKAIHAGLEPGVLASKRPGLRMISFGPDIRDPHSPRERVNVASVERFWKLLVETLRRLAGASG